MGNRGWGQFIELCLCRSFLLMLFPGTSVGSHPRGAILHELLQLSRFHGVQSFRNRLLQCGSPMGPQNLTENLLPHELLSTGRSSWQQPSLVWALHGLHQDDLPHQGLFHGMQGILCSGAWSTPPFFFSHFGAPGLFLSHFSSLLTAVQHFALY